MRNHSEAKKPDDEEPDIDAILEILKPKRRREIFQDKVVHKRRYRGWCWWEWIVVIIGSVILIPVCLAFLLVGLLMCITVFLIVPGFALMIGSISPIAGFLAYMDSRRSRPRRKDLKRASKNL